MERWIAAATGSRFSKLNMFASLKPDDIREQAAESTRRFKNGRPLSIFDGVPIAVKDMIRVRGHCIHDGLGKTMGTSCLSDDPIVARFRAAGAIIVGTTVMTEGGVTPLGWSAHWQGPLNPYNFEHYSGGSSGGSAVAVAVGLVPVAIGFDGGGSIRIPAAASGVFGLGCTFGRVPTGPTGPFDATDSDPSIRSAAGSTMIKTGPLAASMKDAALAYAVMSPSAPNHFYSQLYGGNGCAPPVPHLHAFTSTSDLSGVRLGMFREWFSDASPAIVNACDRAVDFLVSRGAEVVPIAIPHLKELSMAHGLKISSEFALGHGLHYWGYMPGSKGKMELEAGSRITVALGSTSTAIEVLCAEKLRRWIFDYLHGVFKDERLTAVVTPTLAALPPRMPEKSGRETGESNTAEVMQMMKFIFLGNLLGMPGLTVPVDFDAPTGLPIGLHFLGNHWGEHELLRIGHALESGLICGGDQPTRRRPSLFFG